MFADAVHEAVEERDEDDDGDGVEVLLLVVWDAVAFHLAGLGDEVVGELAVDLGVKYPNSMMVANGGGDLRPSTPGRR